MGRPFHFLVHFEPLPGMADAFREELQRIRTPTRSEPGCLDMQIFESVREPVTFALHSLWTDEAAFDRHIALPHTVTFVKAAEPLLTHPIRGQRLRGI